MSRVSHHTPLRAEAVHLGECRRQPLEGAPSPAAAGLTSTRKRRLTRPGGGDAGRALGGEGAALGAAEVGLLLERIDLRPFHERVPEQPLGVGLVQAVRVQRQQHVLGDRVPALAL